MKTRIQKWGNSQGLRIPKSVLEAAGIAIGQEIEIQSSSRHILLKKSPGPRRKHYKIEDLLARMPKSVKSLKEIRNKPRGREAW